MSSLRRRGAALVAYGLGAALVLSSLTPFGPAAADGSRTHSAPGWFENPNGNPVNSNPLVLDDGRVVISPDDPQFLDGAQDLISEVEQSQIQVVPVDPAASPDPAATPAPGTDPAATPAPGADPAVTPAPAPAVPAPVPPVPASPALPSAPVPDPLDFANQPDDPANYLIPAAAEAYRQGDTYRIPRPAPGGPAAGASYAGLEEFYGQQISWGPCGPFDPAGQGRYDLPGLECGYLIVPVDYANPAGPTAAIGLLKLPARNQAAKIGSIFVDPGGPGSSGMSTVASFARGGGAAELNETFDIIGFDPRGVSSSLPMIRCGSSAAFDAKREGSDGLTGEQEDRILEHNTNECYRHTGAAFGISGEQFISQVGTVNVVRDLDIARAAVGDADLSYLGYSYGTSIGYQYAMAFPDNIRAMILDGVVNPFQNNPAEGDKYAEYIGGSDDDSDGDGTSQIEGFQATLEQFLKRCAASDGFDYMGQKLPCALGTSGDVNEMMAQYQELSQRAWGGTFYETKEADVSKRRAVSFEDVKMGTVRSLYTESLWPGLNAALHQLRAGDGTLIMSLADWYYQRDGQGRYSFSESAFQTIRCTDGGAPEEDSDPQQQIADQLKGYASAPFTDPGKNADGTQRGLAAQKDSCSFYRTQNTLPLGQSLQAMPNILYVSTTYDSSTPYEDGVVAAAASQGTLLTVAGANHGSFLGSSECAAQIGITYFNTLVVPGDIPGNQGVETKDIYSKVITGDECQVHSFRPVPAIAPAEAGAGETVTMTASGLVRNTGYAVTLPEGYALASGDGTVTSAADGMAQVQLVVPAGAQPGTVEIGLTPADPAANDPTVKPTGQLTIRAAGQQGGTGDQSGQGTQPGQDDSGREGHSGQDPQATPEGQAGGDLAVTGGQLPIAIGVIAVLLLAAGVTIAILRRRTRD